LLGCAVAGQGLRRRRRLRPDNMFAKRNKAAQKRERADQQQQHGPGKHGDKLRKRRTCARCYT
jgi:hypothetical protein